MKLKILLIVLAGVFLSCPLALADTIQTSGVWTAVPNPIPATNSPNRPFWDNASLDNGKKNAGYILTGTNDPISGYVAQNWLGYSSSAQYLSAKNGLGNPTGGVVNDVYFTNNLGGQSAYLIIEVAGYASTNIFGVYDLSNPNNKTVIFNGPAGQTATWAGPVPAGYTSYGFYLTTQEGKTFYSDTTGVVNPDNNSNFAFFRNTSQPDAFYIAMEDLKAPINTECIGDYNDMIIKATFAPVPLPPSVLLLGSGLLGLLGWRRFKKA